MSTEPVIDDEEYASSEDSDFAPEDAPDNDAAAESSDEDAGDDNDDAAAAAATASQSAAAAPSKKRKQAGDAAAEDAGFANSGDEAIIEKGKKRQKKKTKTKGGRAGQNDDDDDEDDDEGFQGGEGGLIKTRSMRAVEKAERKAQPVAGPVTVDVDALWASMIAAPDEPVPPPDAAPGSQQEQDSAAPHNFAAASTSGNNIETIRIKRTYNFAGKVHTEEKLVPRDSAEARVYLASQKKQKKKKKKNGAGPDNADSDTGNDDDGEDDDDDDEDDEQQQQPEKRMPRKAFRSAFEPALLTPGSGDGAGPQRADLNLGIAARLQARDATARKLNTVEKSRMDWAGFVDKEGIKDELVLAGRAKGNFASQQDFLARTEARREDDARRVRLARKA